MRKKLWSKIGYGITTNYCGFFNLDNSGSRITLRDIFEDLALLRSYAVFEVMEAENGVVFHFEDHFKRLAEGMTFLRMPIPPKVGKIFPELKKFLKERIKETISANRLKSSVVYVLATGGRSEDLFHPSSPSNIFILVKPFSFPRFRPEKALKLKTIDFKRQFPNIKTTNYLAAEISLFGAYSEGYDDVLYAPDGMLLEASRANLFFIKEGRKGGRAVITPKDVLPGVTSSIVLAIAKNHGMKVFVENISKDDMGRFKEAFLASTTIGVWPVVKINGNDFPVGEETMKLRRAFLQYRKRWYRKRLT